MSDFSVNIGPRLARQGGSAAQVLSAVVPDPPQSIRSLDSGTILKGVVQGKDHDGMTVIATDKGAIKVSVNPSPAAGTKVTLEVRIAGDRLQVLILAMDNAQPPVKGKAETGETGLDPVTARSPGAPGNDKAAPTLQPPASRLAVTNAPSPAPAAIVTRTGMVVEAIVVRGDQETLRQIASTGPAALAQLGGVSQPPRASPQLDQNTGGGAPSLAKPSVLQPEMRAQIERLFGQQANSSSENNGTAGRPAGNLAGPQAPATGAGARPSTNEPGVGPSVTWTSLPAGAEVRIRIVLPIPPAVSDRAAPQSAPEGSAASTAA